IGAWNRAEVGNVAQPHMRQGGRNVPVRADSDAIPASTMDPAGGVRCSLNDMLRWMQAWLRTEPAQSPWLSRDQRRALWLPQMAMALSGRQRGGGRSRLIPYGHASRGGA